MRSKNNAHVFIYGTLKPGGLYHKDYCGGFNLKEQEAPTAGKLFDFPELGYPSAMEASDGTIRGYLLTFDASEIEVLSKLDVLEGYIANNHPGENEYYRKRVPVFTGKGYKAVERPGVISWSQNHYAAGLSFYTEWSLEALIFTIWVLARGVLFSRSFSSFANRFVILRFFRKHLLGSPNF